MDIINQLTARIRLFHEFQMEQLTNHPEYGLNGDIRISLLTKLLFSMTGYQLSLIHSEIQLKDRGWWDHFFNDQVNDQDIQLRTSSYNHISLIGFFQGIFMSLESSLRSISIALDPSKNKDGKAEFANIYKFIFARLNLHKYNDLFDILRLIRNTNHNNGMFIPVRSGNLSITYKGRTFDFKENKLVEYLNQVDNSNLYYFLDEILLFLNELFNHSDILAITKIEEKVSL